MNVVLLEQVRDVITAQPERFSAAHWGWARNAGRVLTAGDHPREFKCCIAGHVLLLSGRMTENELLSRSGTCYEDGYLWQQAAEALELPRRLSSRLFFPSQWENPYKQRYYLCTRTEEASVVADYIDFFLHEHAPKQPTQPEESLPEMRMPEVAV